MTKEEMMDRLAERFPDMGKRQVRDVCDAFVGLIVEGLRTGQNRVRIPRIGVLSAKYRPEYTARNPRTGEQLTVAPTTRIRFKAAENLPAEVNLAPPAGTKPASKRRSAAAPAAAAPAAAPARGRKVANGASAVR